MSLPNVPTLYQKIGRGARGGHEFAMLINLLLRAEAKDLGAKAIISSDRAGDFKGVDCIIETRMSYRSKHDFTGFQYKFCASPLESTDKAIIKKSLQNARKKFPEMSQWVLVLPDDLNKHDMAWFTSLAKEFHYRLPLEDLLKHDDKRKPVKSINFDIYLMGHISILEMMLKHSHVGRRYYPELFTKNEGKLILDKISVNTKRTNWINTADQNTFALRTYYDKSRKSNELVMDFQFLNNSSDTHLLKEIKIRIIKVWSSLKGLCPDIILLSSGEIEFEINFKKKINKIIFEEIVGGPIVFRPKAPIRFGLHLLKFTDKCPGNNAILQFEFVFDSQKLTSDLITFDF